MSKLYVGNLSYSTSEETLRAIFEEEGRSVADVAIIMDRETGQSRGFAFVTMGSPADAQSAIDTLDGREVDGRRLRVNEARDRRGGGSGPGGGRSGGGDSRRSSGRGGRGGGNRRRGGGGY